MAENLRQNQEDQQEPVMGKELEEKDDGMDRAKKQLGLIFDSHKNGEDRISGLISTSKLHLYADFLDVEKIRNSLDACSRIENREEFIESVFLAVKPIWDFQKNNPKDFESVHRRVHHEMNDAIQISEVLSYNMENNAISIHLGPAHYLGITETKKSVVQGLKDLAKIVKKNEDIEKIVATSWIVAKNPKLIEKLGFTVTKQITEEEKREHNIKEERPMSQAIISREDFLNKYLE